MPWKAALATQPMVPAGQLWSERDREGWRRLSSSSPPHGPLAPQCARTPALHATRPDPPPPRPHRTPTGGARTRTYTLRPLWPRSRERTRVGMCREG